MLFRKILKYSTYIIASLFISIYIINFYVVSVSEEKIFNSIENIPKKSIGLVLGASVKANKEPSDILKNRLKVALKAYETGKIDKIIVSGDNRVEHYNEPVAMQKYLIKLGVNKDDIYLDYAGFDTYDSLYRAKHIFLTENLVVFTQGFHQNRAVYIGNSLGINTIGISTDLQDYLGINYFEFREYLSRVKAFLEVEILKSKPKFLGNSIEIVSDEKIENIKKEVLKTKPSDSLPILMYHYIRDVNRKNDLLGYNLSTSPESFEKQMKYLSESGYKTVNSEDILNGNITKKDILLIFDDGYKDFYIKALPILKKYDFKASVGIICSKIGQNPFMNNSEIKEIISYGIEIINHTQNHLDLRKLSLTELKKEIASCQSYLEDEFAVNTYNIIYPSGRYNNSVLKFLKQKDYKLGFTTKAGISDLNGNFLELSRVRIDNRVSFKGFVEKIGE